MIVMDSWEGARNVADRVLPGGGRDPPVSVFVMRGAAESISVRLALVL
jgi:hypothetical protein